MSNPIAHSNAAISVKSFAVILMGLLAIFAALYFLHLEEALNLFSLFSVVIPGFILYAFAPLKLRLPLLFLLNVTAIFVILGLKEGAVMLAFSLALFGILNLPVSVSIRTILLIAAGLVLALLRLKYVEIPFGNIILPVVSGLFMFRAILFLHEQRFIKKQSDWWMRLNYFFLLPNLVFVIFPVVDYKTFVSNYYSKPAFDTYRKGVMWMANGVVHFFLYRLIYYYFVPNPAEIEDVFGWLQFVIASYMLIVRLAGIFHFSAGVICLFGFDLPPTFNHYFFADSFSDLWRRVNMYWRDFMMKVFYYPIYFKVKNLGTVKAIAVSILITFIFNWLLHAYQWFWIRGTILFTLQDVSFWAIFGIAVMLNSVYLAWPRKKKKSTPGFNIVTAGLLMLRIMGIFIFMSVLWSWWTTPSVDAWIGLMSVWKEVSVTDLIMLISGFAAFMILGIIIKYIQFVYAQQPSETKWSASTLYFVSIVGISLLSLLAIPQVSSMVGKRFNVDMDPVIHTRLNEADKVAHFRGYYESMLAEKNLLPTPLDEVFESKPDDWRQLHTLDALIRTEDMMAKKLKPNLDLTFKGARLQTNDLGLRDRHIEKIRPEGTLRIALLGGSIEMGSGVNNDETFENLVEDSLTNEELFKPYDRVEIVNFAIPGTHLPNHLARLDNQVPDLLPDAVIYTAHSDETRRVMSALYRIYIEVPRGEYPYVDSLFASLNLPTPVDEASFNRNMRPKMQEFITWGLTHIHEKILSLGATPIWMFVPSLEGLQTPEEDEMLAQLAKSIGFYVLDLHDFKGDIPEKEIALRSWDLHPNAKGHALIAKKMIEEIHKQPDLIEQIRASYKNK